MCYVDGTDSEETNIFKTLSVPIGRSFNPELPAGNEPE